MLTQNMKQTTPIVPLLARVGSRILTLSSDGSCLQRGAIALHWLIHHMPSMRSVGLIPIDAYGCVTRNSSNPLGTPSEQWRITRPETRTTLRAAFRAVPPHPSFDEDVKMANKAERAMILERVRQMQADKGLDGPAPCCAGSRTLERLRQFRFWPG